MTNLIPILLAATLPLRNPFWPIGFAGERESITDEPRVRVVVASESTDDNQTSITAEALAEAEIEADETRHNDRLWIAARKTLRIGGTMRTTNDRQAITINGKIYAAGDLISINFEGRRFTWRIKGLNGKDTLKLQRVRFRQLDEETDQKGNTK